MGNLVARGLSLGSLVGVVLGQVGPGGCLWWRFVGVTLYVVVFLVREGLPPLAVVRFPYFLKHLALALLAFCLNLSIYI